MSGWQLVRSGGVPSLADGFNARLETATGLAAALAPGGTVVLVPDQTAAEGVAGLGRVVAARRSSRPAWLSRCGGRKRSSCCSGSWPRAGHRRCPATWRRRWTRLGSDPAGDAESVAARFVSWLSETTRPWLVVLDDLTDAADLDGLWPAGPTGRVLITTANSAAFTGERGELIQPVGVFSPREALSYLMGRLTADPDQRMGAIDLVHDLGYDPLALAQASAVIASSALSCRDYQDHFLNRRDQLTGRGRRRACRLPRSPGRYRSSRRPGWHPAAPARPCWRLPRSSTAMGSPALPSPRRPRAHTSRAGGAGRRRQRRRGRPGAGSAAMLVAERAGLLTTDQAETTCRWCG